MEKTECLIPTYGLLSKQEIAVINKNSHLVHHRKGEKIFIQDRPVSHLIFIKTGLVKLSREHAGNKEIIIDIIQPGSFIGLPAIFYKELYPYSSSSIEGGEMVYTSISVFLDVITKNGKYASHYLSILSSRIVFLMDRMICLTNKQVPGRMAEMLLNFSKITYNSNAFTLPISRSEIADFLQTTKETVSRTLTEFKNDRIIELDDKNVVLKSLDLLETLNRMG